MAEKLQEPNRSSKRRIGEAKVERFILAKQAGMTGLKKPEQFKKRCQVLEVRKSNRLRPDRINIMESLILAQNERWRRVLSMQVERQGLAIDPRAADW